ncbi:hypothetical protein DL767_004648 [Monosporascus sp. MG133]|nr:hypothetical protein DL767_004648 [Monosporascus sp. MG133]
MSATTSNTICSGWLRIFSSQKNAGKDTWMAIILNKVNRGHLDQMEQLGYPGSKWREVLPVEPVCIDNSHSGIAVLSWRWDTHEKGYGSRNLLAAIIQAKNEGYRHLLADVVSVDQDQSDTDVLLDQVARFSELYSTLPVIAAYDMQDCQLIDTMRRPWIVNEIQLYRHNRSSVTYVSHQPNQGAQLDSFAPVRALALMGSVQGAMGSPNQGYMLGSDLVKYQFGDCLERVWATGLTNTLLRMIEGKAGMHDISDLRYIMPQYAAVLRAAFDKMPRQDYLMTAAILSAIESDQEVVVSDETFASTSLSADMFKWYGFNKVPRSERQATSTIHQYIITLGKTIVARLVDDTNSSGFWGHGRATFQIAIGAEKSVCSALGMATASVQRKKARGRRKPKEKKGVRWLRTFTIASVDLDAERIVDSTTFLR